MLVPLKCGETETFQEVDGHILLSFSITQTLVNFVLSQTAAQEGQLFS